MIIDFDIDLKMIRSPVILFVGRLLSGCGKSISVAFLVGYNQVLYIFRFPLTTIVAKGLFHFEEPS